MRVDSRRAWPPSSSFGQCEAHRREWKLQPDVNTNGDSVPARAGARVGRGGEQLPTGFHSENGQMTEVFTIGNEELAILCDFVGGWGGKWATNNLQTDKKQALDRLIANGFIKPATDSVTKCQHTEKTELLFAQLCVA
jgi:hypothetical protein